MFARSSTNLVPWFRMSCQCPPIAVRDQPRPITSSHPPKVGTGERRRREGNPTYERDDHEIPRVLLRRGLPLGRPRECRPRSGIDGVGGIQPPVQDEKRDDGLRAVLCTQIGSRVDVGEQASNVDRFLYYLRLV